MRRATILAAALLALAIPCAAADRASPQSISASYDLFRSGFHFAVISETFEAKNGLYQLVSETRAIGLFALIEREPLRFTSSGRLSDAGLQPLSFAGKRSDTDPRQVRGELDWQAGKLKIVHDGITDTLALPPGTQDRLSVMYQFMFMGAETLRRLDFNMTNGRNLTHYDYTVHPGVEIDTPLGRLTTLHLVKERRPGESVTEVWLSPQHRNLPVRVLVQEQDGARYEQFITSLEIRDAPP